jgi:hypothetical protein
MICSGLITPIAQIPTPDLAVPYAAPKPALMVHTAENDGDCTTHRCKEGTGYHFNT